MSEGDLNLCHVFLQNKKTFLIPSLLQGLCESNHSVQYGFVPLAYKVTVLMLCIVIVFLTVFVICHLNTQRSTYTVSFPGLKKPGCYYLCLAHFLINELHCNVPDKPKRVNVCYDEV